MWPFWYLLKSSDESCNWTFFAACMLVPLATWNGFWVIRFMMVVHNFQYLCCRSVMMLHY